MKIQYIHHACQELSYNSHTLLTDPWLRDGIYDGSWGMSYLPGKLAHELIPNTVTFSSIRPNHYDPLSIMMIKPQSCQYIVDETIATRVQYDGFKPCIVPDEQWTQLTPGLELARIASDDVYCSLVRSPNGVVLFVPDMINQEAVKKINTMVDHIDLAYIAYSTASAWPQCYFELNEDEFELCAVAADHKREKALDYVAQLWRMLNMPAVVLYGSDYTLIGRHARLNEYRGLLPRDDAATSLRQLGVRGILDVHPGGSIELIGRKPIIRTIGNTHYISTTREDRLYPYELQFNAATFNRFPIHRTIEACASRMAAQYMVESTRELDDWTIVLKLRSHGLYKIAFNGVVTPIDVLPTNNYLLVDISISGFLAAALSVSTWHSLEVGSHIKFKSVPGGYIKQMHKLLGFMFI